MADRDAVTVLPAEQQLVQTLQALRQRIADDEKFAVELYRGLTNRRWHRGGGIEVSVSWGRAEDLINEQREAAGRPPLDLRQTGHEGELTDDVRDALGGDGWRSEPLNTSRNHEPHAENPESPPPPDAGERQAPVEESAAERWGRAHEEADAGHRLFAGRPGESGAKAGRDPHERAAPST